MDIKKLNEEIEQILEISDPIRQAVVDKRRQNAANAIDKYARASRLAGRKNSIVQAYDNEVKQDQPSLIDLAINALKDGDFSVIDNDDKLSSMSLADIVVPNIDEFSVDELTQIMNQIDNGRSHDYSLFPSGWDDDTYGPYPKKLAQALVDTNAEESVFDLYNIFYGRRLISDDAIKVFKQAVLTTKSQRNLRSLVNLSVDSDDLFNVLDELFKHWPVFTSKLLTLMSDSGDSDLTEVAAMFED